MVDALSRIDQLVLKASIYCSQEDVKDLFAKYGPVKDVYIPLDYHTKKRRGFAFVEFVAYDDAA